MLFRLVLLSLLVAATRGQDLHPYQQTDLPPYERAADLVDRLSLEQKARQLDMTVPTIAEFGIPAHCWWNEAISGVARRGTATQFPQAICMAASWDTNLVERLASAAIDQCDLP